MTVRELRVTDIRCRLCDAGPGEWCRNGARQEPTHSMRIVEHARLAAEGWQWQEVDPYDAGARKGAR